MKTKIVLLISFILSTALPVLAQKDTLVVKTTANCSMCKKNIESGLRFEKGVQQSVVDVSKKTVTIIYRADKTNAVQLRTAISNIGYAADTIPANKIAHDKLPKCCQAGGHQ